MIANTYVIYYLKKLQHCEVSNAFVKKIISSFEPYYLEIGIYECNTFKGIDRNY